MKLFIVHAGYYDSEIGIYELHTNFLVAAENVSDVNNIIQEKKIFRSKNMHIDAIQEIEAIDGYKITLVADKEGTRIKSYDYAKIKQLEPLP